MLLLRALAELIAPHGCAACDVLIGPNAIFCRTCAATVEETLDPIGAFAYGGAVAQAIRRFKFRGRSDLIARFATRLVPLVPVELGSDAVVVPVPIHPVRLAERGYNQSALLARPVARAHGLRFAPRALERVRDTSVQTALDREARRANVDGAFLARTALHGRQVLLVDDVRTTGSTLRACADALHEVGARRVFPLVLACRDGSAL
jgi:ComF family protein